MDDSIPQFDSSSPADSTRQGQEFIAQVHQKMSKLVQEFANGSINRSVWLPPSTKILER